MLFRASSVSRAAIRPSMRSLSSYGYRDGGRNREGGFRSQHQRPEIDYGGTNPIPTPEWMVPDNTSFHWLSGNRKAVYCSVLENHHSGEPTPFVNIRSFGYIEEQDKTVPTKKGIALNRKQYEELKEIILSGELDRVFEEHSRE